MMKNCCILIPSTFTAEEKNLLLRTYKIGLIGRYVSIFGVPEIIVYYDPDPLFNSHGLGKYISKILKYINTPPWLRKYCFPLEKDLKYVGYLEPLNTLHHSIRVFKQYTWGFVKKSYGKKGIVCFLTNNNEIKEIECKFLEQRKEKQCILIDIKRRREIYPKKLKFFFGYYVKYINKELDYVLNKLKSNGYFLIGTSKYGNYLFNEIELIKKKLNKDKVAIIFGSPFRGLKEILKENINLLDCIVNLVLNQQTKTIRTEEAILIALSLLTTIKQNF